MADCLVHRGPDDQGVWTDSRIGVALSHRRLSIVDLSSEGHQPMVSASGRYVLVYNGEVYNFASLRTRLEHQGLPFRGHSDTEVVLAAIEAWGLKSAVCKFNGMFAFAVWDRAARRLSLVRDRMGIKPLYYGRVGNSFVFGSEIKSLRAHPGFSNSIDRGALTLYMRYGYVPAPMSIYDGILKMLPGQILDVSIRQNRIVEQAAAYWSAKDVAEAGLAAPFSGTDDQAVHALDQRLRDAVALRMVADVPVGAFLSGGYDSSLVSALMQVESSRAIRTFSISLADSDYDESRHARAVATYLGTEHTELLATANDAIDIIPRLPLLYDEPFADSSQVPTFLVSQLAREQVTVSLTGDGGDELFGGYNRHTWGPRVWGKVRPIPMRVRSVVASAFSSASPQAWNRTFERVNHVLPQSLRVPHAGEKMHKLTGMMAAEAPNDLYAGLVSQWTDPKAVVLRSNAPAPERTNLRGSGVPPGLAEQMMFWDLAGYLPDDILTKVDRASMGVSLEARVPLLDHRIAEFAWQLPIHLKIRGGKGKWILRQVLYQYVPADLIDRPKAGFDVPIGQWLRGPLRQWAENLLDRRRLGSEGYLDSDSIRTKWAEHLAGNGTWQHEIWTVLMFQAWLESQ